MALTRFGSRTTDGAIVAGAIKCRGFYVTGDGSNAAHVIFYDAASATGTVLCELACPATESFALVIDETPIQAEIGIYADVTTVGRAGAFFD